MAGPTLCFYAFEQGPRFAARASYGTLVGLVAIPCFCVAYAYSGKRARWPVSLLAGWSSFLLALLLFKEIQADVVATWVLLAAACTIGYRVLPMPLSIAPGPPHSKWDLPLRMTAAAALVVVLTGAADRLGPEWSGLLAPFPVATAIIAAFTHAQRGVDSVVVYFRGFLPALVSFGLFCLVLALALEPFGLTVALLLALAAQLSTQSITLWSMTRVDRTQTGGTQAP
ncbi:MAG TPA: hypothetical protein VIX63_18285 [Vicinamibacterales bacterium]